MPDTVKLRHTDYHYRFASRDAAAERFASYCAIQQHQRLALEAVHKAIRDATCRDGNSR
jgi:hypothetical protein